MKNSGAMESEMRELGGVLIMIKVMVMMMVIMMTTL